MASGWTNKGCAEILDAFFRGASLQTNYYVALCTDANTPDADTNLLSDLTEIAAGSGYTSGGYQLTPNGTDFDTLTENDTDDRAICQIKDVVYTASGGTIPDSGDGARWGAITDDNVTVADRIVYGYLDLTSARAVSDGQTLTLQDIEFRLQN